MVRSQKVGCAILAGVLILEAFLGAACTKKEKKDSSSTSQETIESESEDPSSISSEETSSEIQQQPVDPVEQEAKALAAELGVSEDELHGKYEFFIKYADCVVNNPKMGEWRAYALHFFPEAADHVPEEHQEFFLEKVRTLKMESMAIEDASGDYNAQGNSLRVYSDGFSSANSSIYTTIYHELTHFLDAFAEGEEKEDLFYTGTRFAYDEELTDEERQQIYTDNRGVIYASFITEGGAELYSNKYFGKSPRSYFAESIFLVGYEYIFGSAALDELFFATDSTMRFVKILQDAGYSDEKICKVFESFNYDTYARTAEPADAIRFEDVLIDLYEFKKGAGWKDDKVFCQILRQINNGYMYFMELPAPVHAELKEIFLDANALWDWSVSIMNQIPEYNKDTEYPDLLCVMIHEDKPYLAARLMRTVTDDDFDPSAIEIDYDFDNGKVLSYEYIEYNYPKQVPVPLPKGQALDERLSSFVHDNSKAHQQTAYSGSADLKALYDRAAELGNKYGVYIHVGEDLPSYIERGDVGDASSLKTALDHVENVLSKFPEGYFDQLNYGYYAGFEIVICQYPLMDEINVYLTDAGYIFNISLECRNQKNLDLIEERLLDAIFTATDKKLMNYFENFEEPAFSDIEWKTYNPVEFCYLGYLDGEKGEEAFKQNKEYVASVKGLRTPEKDRSQLMTALLLSRDVSATCEKKAEYYSRMIREAFDDSTWPEKTVWEEEIAKQMDESGQKAA